MHVLLDDISKGKTISSAPKEKFKKITDKSKISINTEAHVVEPSISAVNKRLIAMSKIAIDYVRGSMKISGTNAWQNSSTMLAGFSVAFISLIVGFGTVALQSWIIFFLALSAFLFLLATEFFAYVSSLVEKEKTKESLVFFDLAAFVYNIGIASLAAGLLILFYSINVVSAVYLAVLFMAVEITLMLYYIIKAVREKKLLIRKRMKNVYYFSITLYVVTLIIMLTIILFALYITGLVFA